MRKSKIILFAVAALLLTLVAVEPSTLLGQQRERGSRQRGAAPSEVRGSRGATPAAGVPVDRDRLERALAAEALEVGEADIDLDAEMDADVEVAPVEADADADDRNDDRNIAPRRRDTASNTANEDDKRDSDRNPSTLPTDNKARYDLLVQRNIFLRSRRPQSARPTAVATRPTPRTETTTQPRPLPNPGRDFALRGVAVHGDRRTAFLEDIKNKSAVSVRVGDLVAGSRIVGIELDYIEIEAKEKRSRITVGQDLTGTTAQVVYVPGLERRSGSATITTLGRSGSDADERGGRNRRGGNANGRGGFGRDQRGGGGAGGGGGNEFERGFIEGNAPAAVPAPVIIAPAPDFDDIQIEQELSREQELRMRRLRELQLQDD